MKTASTAKPAYSRRRALHVRVSRCTASGKPRHYDRTASSGSVVANDPVNQEDPSGECPQCVTGLIGAGLGAVIGAGFEIGTEVATTGHVDSWGSVGTAALGGAVSGGVIGATGNVTLGTSLGTAVQAGADSLRNNPHDLKGAAIATAEGAAVGAIAGKLAPNLTAAGKGAMGTGALAKAEKVTNMMMGRMRAGQVAAKNLAPATVGKIIAGTVSQSVGTSIVTSGGAKITQCVNKQGGC